MATPAYSSLWHLRTRSIALGLTQFRRVGGYRFLAILFCTSLVACQAAYGDYKAGVKPSSIGGSPNGGASAGGNTSPGGAAGNSSGGSSSTAGCTEKSHRCAATAIETCRSGKWVSETSCNEALCDASTGTCMLCPPGGNRCSAFNLQTCSSKGTEWTTTAQCQTSDYCDAVSDTCFTCLPGEAFCDGAALNTCNDKKNGWSVTDCGDPDNCDAREGCVPPCPDTSWVSCNKASLIGCDENHRHIQLDVCASSQLCTKTVNDKISNPDGFNGKCEEGCNPNTYRCNPENPAELQACPPSGLGWEHVETCGTPALCNAGAQKCDSGCGVAPGTYRCEDAKLELCRDDGTAWDVLKTCQDESHCNTQKLDCLACVPGEFQCSGATLQTCGTDLTWSTVQTCASAALCNAPHGSCEDPACTQAGKYQCVGTVLQQCASDLTAWVTKDTCVTSALCNSVNGRCDTPQCLTPGAYRCNGNARQICDDATRAWKDVNTCLDGQVCDLTVASGCTGTCTSSGRCNSVYAQKCTVVNNLPQWQTTATCATADLCVVTNDVAACKIPTCSVGQYTCTNNALQKCNSGRTDYDLVAACTGKICDATLKQCDICNPNTYTCATSLNQLLKCSADGLSNPVVDNCSPTVTNNCYTSSDRLTGYCYRCNSGDSQCSGTSQIQTCATDRRGWNTATTCSNGCQDNTGSADYCATCPTAGEVQCVQSSSPGSTRTCSSDRKSWSSNATCTQGNGCVDNGTADYCATTCAPNQASCVGTAGRHVCNADGKGFSTTTYECLDSTNQKACSGGVLTTTAAPCTGTTPYCVNGQCVECNANTCAADGVTPKICSNGKVVTSTPCSGTTPYCVGGACVECTGTTKTCSTDGVTLKTCSNGKWVPSTCSAHCDGGACVDCLSSYVPTCTGTGIAIQSCSSGKFATTNCTGDTPVCYAASTTTPAICVCDSNAAPTCLADGKTLHTCVNRSYTDKLCTDISSTAGTCIGGKCVCDENTPKTCPSSSSYSSCNLTNRTVETTKCPDATPVCLGAGNCVECANSAPVCTKSVATNTWYDGWSQCTNNKKDPHSCLSTEVCDPADDTCKPATCGVGQAICASDTVLNTCNATRTGWVSTTCSGACYAGACVTCKPGSTRCNGETGLQTCLADGSGWSAAVSQCADNGSLKVCDSTTNTWSSTSTKTCPTTAPVCNTGTNACVAATCNVNEAHCSEDHTASLLCNSTRTGFDSTTCTGTTPVCLDATNKCGCSSSASCPASAPVCNTSTNVCVAATCNVNEAHCSEDHTASLLCNSTRTGFDSTTCTGTTPVCLDTTNKCGCSSSTSCPTSTPVCNTSTNVCVEATCNVNEAHCSLDHTVSQLCNATRTGFDSTTCTGVTPVCLDTNNKCGCSLDSQCPSAAPVCSLDRCQPCLVSTECSSRTATPVCSSQGACVACDDVTAPCPTGLTCQPGGSCLASSPP